MSRIMIITLRSVFCTVALLAIFPQISLGEINTTGDVAPGDPANWAEDIDGYVGKTGDGTMGITSGSDVSSHKCFIGFNSGISGIVTVDGIGSTLTNKHNLYVGYFGSGVMYITGRGAVNSKTGLIGDEAGSLGRVDVAGDGSIWTTSASIFIGNDGNGSLNISDSGEVSCSTGYIGDNPGSTGEVTVDGSGSLWKNRRSLYVGDLGNGILNITNGANVTVAMDTIVRQHPGSSGTINFDNGTLSTVSLFCDINDLDGTGTINTNGLVCDVDLVFDSAHGVNQTFNVTDGHSQNITFNINVNGTAYMGAGFNGVGTMGIFDGVHVESTYGYIGYRIGSAGEVTVQGLGSTWTNSDSLYVGRHGSGILNITGGGMVDTQNRAYIGLSDATSLVTVDGLGSKWAVGSSITIGSRSNGVLNIRNKGVVDSDYDIIIGNYSGSTGTVTVDGTDSILTSGRDLYVGKSGSGTLNITDGGMVVIEGVTDSSGTINFDSGTLTTGSLLCASADITGSGTINTYGLVSDVNLVFDSTHGVKQTFIISDNPGQDITVNLDVDGSSYHAIGAGFGGSGTMSVSDGVIVTSIHGHIGYHAGSTGTVTVDGPDSMWKNTHLLYIGNEGDGTLDITSGGEVYSRVSSYIGFSSGSTGVVTVNDSIWTNMRDTLYIGDSGNGKLEITNGGIVIVEHKSAIGSKSGSTGKVIVDGTDSKWTIGGDLFVGEAGSGALDITGGGMVVVEGVTYSPGAIKFNTGTLTTRSLLCASNDFTGSGTINTHGLVADVDLVFDSTHGVSQIFNISDNSGQNIDVNFDIDGSGIMGAGYKNSGTMSILDGLTIDSTRGYIGYLSGSTGEVTVDGENSTWSISGMIFVGYEGSGTLNITDGGSVINTEARIGYHLGSTGEVTVDGKNSTWTNRSLMVGKSGRLNITNGGVITSEYGSIHSGSLSTSKVTVDGAGSMWIGDRGLSIGGFGECGLDITGGGIVNFSGIGIGSLGSTGEVNVEDAESTLINATINIGHNGYGTLNITNGGTVITSFHGYIGRDPGSEGTVTIDGAESTWESQKYMSIGSHSKGTLNITGGGSLIGGLQDSIGHGFDSTGKVTVNGLGSTWTCSPELYVGRKGNGTLNITGEGLVSSTLCYIGETLGSAGKVTVGGDNSTWTNNGKLYIGNKGFGALNITDGGTVSNLNCYIGYFSDSTGNITIDGADSTWSSSVLNIGHKGFGALNITDGGTVSNSSGRIGYASGSTGEVVVDGINSRWTNKNTLIVGRYGNGTLNIKNGSSVSNTSGYISYYSSSVSVVTVDGNGSIWANSGDLFVANEGKGTLNITNGGAVTIGGNLNIGSQSMLNILLVGQSDPLLDVAGDTMLDGMLNVSLAEGFALNQGDRFILIDLTGSNTITGTFTGLAEGDSVGSFGDIELLISYAGGDDGNDVTLSAVPEPATMTLLALGGLAMLRRRRR